MDENLQCPGETTLLDFVAERLDAPASRQVRDHLPECVRCSQRVEWIKSQLLKEDQDELAGGSSSTKTLPSHFGAVLKTQNGQALDEDAFDCSLLVPSSNKKAIGRLGKYDVYGVVGHGGMGVVLQAFDEQLRRTVAIKVLNRQLASSPTARRRFIREARAAAGINHENVVTIYDVDEHQDCPFLVMEYVGGVSLKDHIRRNRGLPALEVIRLSKEIASGLAAAHAQGVIHRDIKPSNIMLEEGGVRVKITDFGLARAAVDNVDLTSHGAAVGTAAYMSPEQVSGEKLDLRSDLFSLGCVMYAMVTGHSPFQGRHSLEMARKVMEFNPPPLEKTHEGTPPVLSEVVSRLLEKDPGARYQSATEVAEILSRYLTLLNQTPTDEMSTVLRAEFPKARRRRRPPRWAVPLLVLVLVAALGSFFFWMATGWNARSETQRTVQRNERRILQSGEPTTYPARITGQITVGSSGEADVASIGEALALAGPGTVIRVLPGEPYAEALDLADARRLRGVRLEGEPGPAGSRPTLAPPDDSAPAVRIRDVSGIVVRGFQIETKMASAVAVEGRAAGITIENLQCNQGNAEEVEPAVLIMAAPLTGQDEAIVLRNSVIDAPRGGQCVRVAGTAEGGQDVWLEGNRFHGRGTLVLLDADDGARLGQVTIERNLFLGYLDDLGGRFERSATNGVNLNLKGPAPARQIRIANNTFLDVRCWLGLVFSEPDQSVAQVCNNLILGSYGVEISSAEQAKSAAANWRWESNWRESVDEGDAEVTPVPDTSTAHPLFNVTFAREAGEDYRLVATLATVKERIELLDRDDPIHADFLLPPPGSPLFNSGYGKDGLPGYVGARGPREADRR